MIVNKFKPKVLVVHNYYQIPGGEDTVVANEMEIMEENGHKAILYSRNNSELNEMTKLQKIILPFTTLFSIKTFKEIRKIIKNQKIDVVHVHNTLNLVSPSVYYAAFVERVPVVQTIHNYRLLCPSGILYRNDNICEECIHRGLNNAILNKCYRDSKLQTLAIALTLKLHRLLGTYKKINAYICLSDFMKEKMSVLIDEDKLFIKPNCMSGKYLPNLKPPLGKSDYYLYVGRLEKNKGIPLLLEAFENLKDQRLLIIGDGTYKETMLREIAERGLTNITYLGYKSGVEKTKLVREAKAVIVPSQWFEPFGMVVLEAYQLLTPVIVSDLGTLPDLVEEEKTGFVFKSGSLESLTQTIIKMGLTKKGDFEKNIKDLVDEKFTRVINYKILLEIYQTLCSNKQEK